MSKLRVLLADNHAIFREGLRALVNSQPDMEVVGEAEDGTAALQKARDIRPDVVVMDFSMPGLDGAQAAERLRQTYPEIKVLALTRHEDTGSLNRMLDAGARGYVLKQSAAKELIHAIRVVASGAGYYIDPKVQSKLVNHARRRHSKKPPHELADQQREVLRLYALGHSIKEIAAHLGVSRKTVETHKARAEQKLDLHGRADIIRYAVRQGWLEDV